MVTRQSRRPRCVAEIRIPGLIYIRVERCPRRLAHLLTLATVAASGWLVARHPWLFAR